MSELSTKRFLNRDGETNSLVMNTSNNTILVENENGDTLANYTNGSWEPTNKAPVDILKDSKKGGTFDRALNFGFKDLSKEDKGKLSIYSAQEEVNNKTIAKNEPKSGQNTGVTIEEINNNDIPKDPEGFFIGRYPLNQQDSSNFDFLKISCYDYQSGLNLDAAGENFFKIKDIDKRKKVRRGVVSLPMQPGISESNSVNWGEDSLNPFQVAGAQVAGATIGGLSNLLTGKNNNNNNETKLTDSFASTGKSVLSGINEDIIKTFFAGQAIGSNILTRGTGLTINNNLEVLFNGPVLRTFNYTYKFTPREPKEADKIKQIIRFFKKQMAPKRSNSRIFLKTPNVWKLKYTYKDGDPHPFLNNIKICALTGFNVDYTPDGSYSTYEDDGGRGDGSMTSYQVGLSFKEITPIYNDDFWNDDEGKEGTGF